MKSKKAVIEIGFAWIFILIAGAVIFGLFAYVGVNHGGYLMDMINAKLVTDLGTIFAGAQVSRNTAAIIEIPETEIHFSCDSYRIDTSNYPLEGRLIFAPSVLKSSRLITWSKSWSLGFRVTNFLYITSPYVKYYIVYKPTHEALAARIYNELPDQLNKELINTSTKLKNEKYEMVIILMLGHNHNVESVRQSNLFYDKNDFKDYDNDEVVFVYAEEHNPYPDLYSYTLVFKDKNQDVIRFPGRVGPGHEMQTLIDKSALYGALISGNPETVQCMMDKALIRAVDLINIYYYRTEGLINSPDSVQGCSLSYQLNGLDSILELKEEIVKLEKDVDEINAKVKKLAELNNLLESMSCPLLY